MKVTQDAVHDNSDDSSIPRMPKEQKREQRCSQLIEKLFVNVKQSLYISVMYFYVGSSSHDGHDTLPKRTTSSETMFKNWQR